MPRTGQLPRRGLGVSQKLLSIQVSVYKKHCLKLKNCCQNTEFVRLLPVTMVMDLLISQCNKPWKKLFPKIFSLELKLRWLDL